MPDNNNNQNSNFGQTLGMQAATGALGGIMGLAIGGINDARQRRQQRRLNEINFDYFKNTADYNFQKQLDMWNATNYGAQMEHLKAAGLNPSLIYGMSGGGATTTGGGGGQSGGSQAPHGGGEMPALIGMGLQNGLMAAQMKLIEAQTAKTKAETTKTAGVDTKEAETRISKLIAETTNEKAKNALIKAETALKEMEEAFGWTTFDDRQDQIYYSMNKTLYEAGKAEEEWGQIREQRPYLLQEVAAKATGATLQNALTEALTKESGTRSAVNNQSIEVMKQEIKNMEQQISNWVQENQIKWFQLSYEEKRTAAQTLMAEITDNSTQLKQLIGTAPGELAPGLIVPLDGIFKRMQSRNPIGFK